MDRIFYLSPEVLPCNSLWGMVKKLGGRWVMDNQGNGKTRQSGIIERDGGHLYVLPSKEIQLSVEESLYSLPFSDRPKSHYYTKKQLHNFAKTIGAKPVSAVPIDISSNRESYNLASDISNEIVQLFGGCMDLNEVVLMDVSFESSGSDRTLDDDGGD